MKTEEENLMEYIEKNEKEEVEDRMLNFILEGEDEK